MTTQEALCRPSEGSNKFSEVLYAYLKSFEALLSPVTASYALGF